MTATLISFDIHVSQEKSQEKINNSSIYHPPENGDYLNQVHGDTL